MRWVMAAAFVVAWSSGFVGATLADRTGAGVWPLLAWRYLVTAGVLWSACALHRGARTAWRSLRWREVGRQGLVGLLAHVAFLGGVFVAARQGLDAGLSALVCALQPLLVATAGRLLFGDRQRLRQWIGMVLALAGVALSVGGVGLGSVGAAGLVVLSLLSLCTAALLERAWPSQTPVLVSLTVQVTAAAAVFALTAARTDGLTLTVSRPLVVAIGWLSLLSGLAGYATFTWCLRRLGATTTSTLLYVTAPVTTLWAWAMFGEAPSPAQWAGLLVVLAGVALATRSRAASVASSSGSGASSAM